MAWQQIVFSIGHFYPEPPSYKKKFSVLNSCRRDCRIISGGKKGEKEWEYLFTSGRL
jgi:hypothetical protein